MKRTSCAANVTDIFYIFSIPCMNTRSLVLSIYESREESHNICSCYVLNRGVLPPRIIDFPRDALIRAALGEQQQQQQQRQPQ